MITKLNEKQTAAMEAYKNKWIEIGLSTKRADRAEAERGCKMAYEAVGLTMPTTVYWCDGPLEGARKAAELSKAAANSVLYSCFWGQHEAGWLSYHDFFLNEVGIEGCSKALGLMTIAQNCGWVWFFDEAVVFTERPTTLKLDNEGRLHCQNGPAVAYKDGLEVYSFRGTVVPKEWILVPDGIDAQTALNWPNIEQRRAAAEIVGWAKILSQLNYKTIDKDGDPQIGELIEVDLPDSPKGRFLRVRCGTGRDFCLPVPAEMKTALEANAWTFGFEDASDIEKFRNYEVRT